MADVPAHPGAPQIQVQIDEELAQGLYSNLVLINHAETEFTLDFAFLPPGGPRAKVRTRVISSPKHTKRLLLALKHNLDRYEARFGRIELDDAPDDPAID